MGNPSHFSPSRSGRFHPGRVGCSRAGMAGYGETFREQWLSPAPLLLTGQCSASQGGPLSGLPFTTLPSLWPPFHHFALFLASLSPLCPCRPLQRFDSHLFRVLLLRRLHLPLTLSSRACRCGRPLDCLGHHRASCTRAVVLGEALRVILKMSGFTPY